MFEDHITFMSLLKDCWELTELLIAIGIGIVLPVALIIWFLFNIGGIYRAITDFIQLPFEWKKGRDHWKKEAEKHSRISSERFDQIEELRSEIHELTRRKRKR